MCAGSIRATPIIRSSIFSDATNTVAPSPRSSKLTPKPRVAALPTTSASKRKAVLPDASLFSGIKDSVTAARRRSAYAQVAVEQQQEDEEEEEEEVEESEEDVEEFEDADEQGTFNTSRVSSEPDMSQLRVQSPIAVIAPRRPASPPKAATPTPKVSTGRRARAVPVVAPLPQPTKRTARKQPAPPPEDEIETPAARKIRGTPKKQAVAQPTSRRGRKQPEPLDVSMDPEVSIRQAADEEEAMDTDESIVINSKMIDPSSIDLPFDDVPAPAGTKSRGGRKSMVASARKSLANEWPQADQDHMLHFFDNLNPQHSETSRIALSCK